MKSFCFTLFFIISFLPAVISQKTTFEEIKTQCSGLKLSKRVRIAVSSFKVATPAAGDRFGDELAQALTNALQNVDCFNVLLSTKDIEDITDEISVGQSGLTKAGSSPKTGNMQGAQVMVMGKVTEFAEGKNSVGAIGLSFGKNKVHIGFIVTLINPETREIIASKSVNVDGTGNGNKGASIFGLQFAGSTTGNKATSDAVEKGIIQTIEFIAASKDKMPLPEGGDGPAAKVYSSSNCPLLQAAHVPKIMVILPEFHITRRIPDPSAETEINRKLIDAGFPVVDAAMYATIQNSARFDEAARDPKAAISLGKEFGADIVIYGEAFSEVGAAQGKQISCRARAEIKAVRTDNATIIATNGLEAGALDNVEFVAAKAALRTAGGLVADYMLEQLCTKNPSFAGKSTTAAPPPKTGVAKSTTLITVENVTYSKLKPLLDFLAANGTVVDKSITEGKGAITFEHSSKLDLADVIESKLSGKFSVKDFGTGKLTLDAK